MKGIPVERIDGGRRLVLGIAVLNLVLSAIFIVISGIIHRDILYLVNPIAVFILFLVLFHFMYRGAAWARWTVVMLFALSALADIAGVFLLLISGAFTFLAAVFGIAFIKLVSAAILVFSQSIKLYYRSGD